MPQFMVLELEWLLRMDVRFLLEEEAKVEKYYLLKIKWLLGKRSNSLFLYIRYILYYWRQYEKEI
jgi:hypothetical protein